MGDRKGMKMSPQHLKLNPELLLNEKATATEGVYPLCDQSFPWDVI